MQNISNSQQKIVNLFKEQSNIDGALEQLVDQEMSKLLQNQQVAAPLTSEEEHQITVLDKSTLAPEEHVQLEGVAKCFFQALRTAKEQESKMLSVPTPPSLSFSATLPYTVLQHNLLSIIELDSIGQLTERKTSVVQEIVFTPERMAIHVLARRLAIDYGVGKKDIPFDQELAAEVPKLVDLFLQEHSSFAQDMRTFYEESKQTISQHLQGTGSLSEELQIALQTAEQGCTLTQDPSSLQALAMRAAGVAYKQRVNKILNDYDIAPFAQQSLKPIPPQSSADRRIFMINGGMASGKGTCEKRIIDQANSEGVNWSEVLVVNTDAFKRLLLDPNSLSSEHKIYYSGLVHDEAALIRNAMLDTYKQRAQEGLAPHCHIDQVWPDSNTVSWAANNPHGLDLTVVQIPVENSFRMAYNRGMDTGRFEPTAGILRSHAGVPKQLLTTLSSLPEGANVRVHIMNNKGKDLIEEIAHIDLKTKTGHIKNRPALLAFFKKTQLNSSAQTLSELYAPQSPIITATRSKEFMSQLEHLFTT
ncbi:MAG: hypothetical protein FJZ58_00925 [Chlamydiae bacterium]|nr:hypothetical protein [Chlamydiota bacterium]